MKYTVIFSFEEGGSCSVCLEAVDTAEALEKAKAKFEETWGYPIALREVKRTEVLLGIPEEWASTPEGIDE